MNVRIYIEGGGATRSMQRPLRIGFETFFRSLREEGRARRQRVEIIMSGSRGNTLRDFQRAVRQNINDFVVLLVDAESSVPSGADIMAFLGTSTLNTSRNQYHLMVQLMEAWFLADISALSEFYGHDFNPNAIPNRSDIENIPKADVIDKLESATRNTSKGKYRKLHASDLLRVVDPQKVRAASPHCEVLFQTISAHIAR